MEAKKIAEVSSSEESDEIDDYDDEYDEEETSATPVKSKLLLSNTLRSLRGAEVRSGRQ